MVVFVMVSVPINMLNLLNELAAIQVLSGVEYAAIATLLLIPQTVAEFLFLAWVLIRGIKER